MIISLVILSLVILSLMILSLVILSLVILSLMILRLVILSLVIQSWVRDYWLWSVTSRMRQKLWSPWNVVVLVSEERNTMNQTECIACGRRDTVISSGSKRLEHLWWVSVEAELYKFAATVTVLHWPALLVMTTKWSAARVYGSVCACCVSWS